LAGSASRSPGSTLTPAGSVGGVLAGGDGLTSDVAAGTLGEAEAVAWPLGVGAIDPVGPG
jgi:hypothetical protein